MKIFRKKLVMPLAALSVAVFLVGADDTGCRAIDDPEFFESETDPRQYYILTVHEIIKYRRSSDLEQEVDTFFGSSVCINRSYFLHSKDIEDIVPVKRIDNPDFYDLRLTLTERGVKLWSAFAVTSRMDRKEMCIVIDGMYYRTFKPAILTDPTIKEVTIEGPFDPATASGLMKNAKRNYRKWNSK